MPPEESAAVDEIVHAMRVHGVLNSCGGRVEPGWVALARRARAAGADSVEDVAALPGARGSVRAWVRLQKLDLDDAQASSQLRKWIAWLQQLQGRRVAALACSPGGLEVLEFLAGTWLADSFRHAQTHVWEQVVIALSIRGTCRWLWTATAWAAEALAAEASGVQPSQVGREGVIWRQWRRRALGGQCIRQQRGKAEVQECLTALAALHEHASGNRRRFWQRVAAQLLILDAGARTSEPADVDVRRAVASVAPLALDADAPMGEVAVSLRAVRVGLATYCERWKVAGKAAQALKAYQGE